jgi:hypothetical protein
VLGKAQQKVAEVVLEENIAEEVARIKEKSDKKYKEFEKSTDSIAVEEFLCDIAHRVKCIGSSMYEIKNRAAPTIPSSSDTNAQEKPPQKDDTNVAKMPGHGPKTNMTKTKNMPMANTTKIKQRTKTEEEKAQIMLQYDCEKIKRNAGFYFHTHNHIPFEDFCKKSHCTYLHHFSDHSLCEVKWCRILQYRAKNGPVEDKDLPQKLRPGCRYY